jgi:hypothetical protein
MATFERGQKVKAMQFRRDAPPLVACVAGQESRRLGRGRRLFGLRLWTDGPLAWIAAQKF